MSPTRSKAEHAVESTLMTSSKQELELRILEAALFVSDLDPFELFKDPKSRALIQRKLGVESSSAERSNFCLKFSKRDEFRSRFAHYNAIFHTYLLFKGILISAFKFLLLQHERNQKNRQDDYDNFNTVNFLRATIKLVGDPLAVLGNETFYLYIGVMGLAFVRLALIRPFYHNRKQKLDMAYIRFLLAPQLEQKRIDARIRQRLSVLEDSIRGYASKRAAQARAELRDEIQSGASRNFVASSSSCAIMAQGPTRTFRGTLAALEKSCANLEDQVRALRLGTSHEIASLRPRVFRRVWLSRIRCQTRALLLTFVVMCAIATAAHDILIAYLSFKASQSCSFTSNVSNVGNSTTSFTETSQIQEKNNDDEMMKCLSFTWSDLLFALEVIFCMSCCTLFELAHTVLFAANIMTQIELIKSTQSELDKCVRRLTRQHNRQLFLCLARSQGRHLIDQRVTCERDDDDDDNNKLLLKLLVGLSVFEGELADGFQVMSDQIVQYLYHVLLVAATLRIAGNSNALAIVTPRFINTLLVIVWLWLNALALLCCSINSRLVELQKRYWSILALLTQIQLCELHCSCCRHWQQEQVLATCETTTKTTKTTTKTSIMRTVVINNSCGETCSRRGTQQPLIGISKLDALKDIWQKFSISTCADNRQHCVRPLGVPLTYRRVIQLNFMAAFIYSLTLTGSGGSSGGATYNTQAHGTYTQNGSWFL